MGEDTTNCIGECVHARVLKKGEKVSRNASITSALLSAVKGVTGWYTGSVALMADAVNSFSDIFASLAVYFGLKFSQKEATKKFPYGYYKAETLASLIVSAVIILAGVEILLESVRSFFNPQEITMASYALAVVLVSAFIYVLLARLKVKVGKEIGSPALISDGKHSLVDTASSGLVFCGIFFSYAGYPWLESIAGVAVSLLVMKMGVELGRYAILVLLDACIKPELLEKSREIAETVSGVEGVHSVKLRRSGPFAFGEMHIETKGTLTVNEAHTISERVEKKIKEEIPEIDSIAVHIEPREGPLKVSRVAVPVKENNKFQSTLSSHVGKAPLFFIGTVEEGEITAWEIVENPAALLEKKRGVKAAEFLAEKNTDILVTEEIGKGSHYTLEAEQIKVKKPEGKTLKDIVLNAAQEY